MQLTFYGAAGEVTGSCHLLEVGGKPLLQYHVENLVTAGFTELVVNISWLGEQIEAFLESRDWGCDIHCSREESPLETAGGIIQALPLLGETPFALVNGDTWTDYPLEELRKQRDAAPAGAWLVLVDNPPQHPAGDFFLCEDGRLLRDVPENQVRLTYSGIAIIDPALFRDAVPGKQPLLPFLERGIKDGLVRGVHYGGVWEDVGTPERLRALDERLAIH